MGEKGTMADDNEKKVVKKKVVKKVVKRPGEEPKPAGEDDALAAFGITETKEVSQAKMVTPVAKPTPPMTSPKPAPTEGGPVKKVVTKKVVKKVMRPVTPEPKPLEAPAKPSGTSIDDIVEAEPVDETEPEPVQTTGAPITDDGKRSGGLRGLLAAKKTTPETKPATGDLDDDGIKDLEETGETAPKVEGTSTYQPQGTQDQRLDDIDLDKITQNIQEDLLETFEEKIDDILVDIIDDEDAVEELTKTKPEKPAKDPDIDYIDSFLEESEAKSSTPVPKPVQTKPPVTRPTTTAPPKPIKTEVEPRPQVKIEPEPAVIKKDPTIDEPVTMEKTEVKVISNTTLTPKTTAPPITKGSDEAIRIEEGDIRERRVAYKVAHNFDKLPPNMRNELLRNLAKVGDPKVREDVVSAIGTHFKTLPPDIQALMTNLARDDDTRVREEVVFEMQKNFDNISMAIRERILKALVMDKEPSVREEVVATICQHYNDLSADVRELLRTLAKDKVRSVREELSFEMQKSDSPIPKEVRDEILGMLKGTR
jgi:hypothetical protein